MASSHFEQFLHEATLPDPDTDCPLRPDCLYGLYVSWCILSRLDPTSDDAFRAAMRRNGIDVHNSRLRMNGPAAGDYILASYPSAA